MPAFPLRLPPARRGIAPGSRLTRASASASAPASTPTLALTLAARSARLSPSPPTLWSATPVAMFRPPSLLRVSPTSAPTLSARIPIFPLAPPAFSTSASPSARSPPDKAEAPRPAPSRPPTDEDRPPAPEAKEDGPPIPPSSSPGSASSPGPTGRSYSLPLSYPAMQKLYHNYPAKLRDLALLSLKKKMTQGQLGPPASASSSWSKSRPSGPESDTPVSSPNAPPRRGYEDPVWKSESSRLYEDPFSARPDHDLHHPHPWHRPTKEELLRYARGFWTRLQIRFKWFTIRSFRRFNADDISAFFTLGSVGTIILFIVGTTTFMSVVFAGAKLLNLDHWIARKLTDYLTAETGVSVVFESAIVPKWREGRISFKNVFISRRSSYDPETLLKERLEVLAGQRRVRVYAEDDEMRLRAHAAGAADPEHVHDATLPAARPPEDKHGGHAWDGMYYEDSEMALPMSARARGLESELLNNNFTMFDLSVDSIDVQLDFGQWWDGKGILRSAVVRGVRGTVDRRQVFWDPNRVYDPKAARRKAKRGDFELERLDVEDVLITIYQPKHFRPFNMSIFSASLPRFRKQWIFYDILSANSITGQFDGCLFSLHTPQSVGKSVEKERLQHQQSQWDRVSRIRIDGVNFDHIQSQSTQATGPIAWILSGRFDVVADLRFPRDLTEDMDINAIFSEIASNLSELVGRDREQFTRPPSGADQPGDERPCRAATGSGFVSGQHDLNEPAIQVPVTAVGASAELAKRKAEESQVALSSEAEAERGRGLTRREKRVKHALLRLREHVQSGEIWSQTLSLLSEDGRQAFLGAFTDDPEATGVLGADSGAGASTGAAAEAAGPADRPADLSSASGGAGASSSAADAGRTDGRASVSQGQGAGRGTGSAAPPVDASMVGEAGALERPSPTVVIDMDVRFKDIKAAVPLFTNQLSYKNHAFVRPIVAFMNANRTLIPIHARIVMDLSEFDGSMDLAQTGLMPIMYDKVYQALAAHVMSQNANIERYRNVSFWTLQLFADSSLQLLRHLRDVLTRRGTMPAQLEPSPGFV